MFKMCGRLKGLILYKDLILPQSREFAEVQAQSYSSGAHRPCSAKAITPLSLINKRSGLAILGLAWIFLSGGSRDRDRDRPGKFTVIYNKQRSRNL
jgi:hypothetical protein